MKAFRTVVVAVILGALFSPAMAMAKTEPQAVPPVTAQQVVTAGVALANAAATNAQTTQSSEAAQYAQREQQAQDVQNFKGGAVYVYFGSGVVLALIIIILILL
jgi:hypothetical protein